MLPGHPVLSTVILERQHDVLPAHVEVVQRPAIRAKYWNLRSWSRIPRANRQEPQPRFLGRLRPCIDRSRTVSSWRSPRACLPAVPTIASTLNPVAAERIQSGDGGFESTPPTKVERRALGRGDSHAVRSCEFVVEQYACRRCVACRRRALRQINSTGLSSSTHFAPCNADAARPEMAHSRCDQSHAATVRCRNEGSARSSR